VRISRLTYDARSHGQLGADLRSDAKRIDVSAKLRAVGMRAICLCAVRLRAIGLRSVGVSGVGHGGLAGVAL
jgi:hypothetical protein